MNRKIIEKMLLSKFNKWVESINDENVKTLVKNNTIITGGCIVSMFQNEPVNDFDIYFTNKETALKVVEYYVNLFNNRKKDGPKVEIEDFKESIKIYIRSQGIAKDDDYEKESQSNQLMHLSEYIKDEQKNQEKNKYKPVFFTSNAITLSDKIQIIIRFFGSPEEIHSNFDFVHCTNYWRSDTKKLYTNTDALESILSKNLYYNGSKYPICSVFRTRKFIKKGWHINAGQYLKMAMQINELDLKNIEVLEDQLVGVDTAYFTEIIERIRKSKEENPDINIDSTYICELVDEVF